MNPLIPVVVGFFAVGMPAVPAVGPSIGCRPLDWKPASLEVLVMLDNAIWEAPEGVPVAEAIDALGLSRIEVQCWHPDTGRFGNHGLPIVRMFTGNRIEALECGIDANQMPLSAPAWRKCDYADELASAAVREVWDAAVEAERLPPVFGVDPQGTPVRLSPPGTGLWTEWARSQVESTPIWRSRENPRVPVRLLG